MEKINKYLTSIHKRLSVLLRNKKVEKKIVIILIVLVIFLSLFPRSIEVLNQNPIFGFDQGREYLAARNIVVNHKFILIGTELGAGSAGLSGLFHGPIYYYLLTIPFILFNGNPAGGTLLMFGFGLFSVFFGYYLGKKIFNNHIGILIALLMSISPILIAQSRFLWSPNLSTLFVLLSFYFIYLFAQNKKNLFIFLAAFFAGFVYNFEMAIAIPLSITLFIYSIYLLRKEFNKYLYLVLGCLLAFSPMVFFEIRHGFIGIKGILNYLLIHKESSSFNLNVVMDHLQSFIFNFKDTFPIDNVILSAIFLCSLLVVTAYLLKDENKKELRKFITFFFFLIPITFIVFIFLRNTVWTYYLIDLSLTYIILFSYVIYAFYIRKLRTSLKISIIILLVLVSVGLYSSVKTSLYDYPDYGGTAKFIGKMDAVDYIYKDANKKPFSLFVFSPPVYTYPYDYLIWWYGEKKYGYIPTQDKKGTFYLLIEPDGEKPWSHKGWLETVIKSGTIIKTVTLPSGFIIQKRVIE